MYSDYYFPNLTKSEDVRKGLESSSYLFSSLKSVYYSQLKILLILTRSASLADGAEARFAPEAGHRHPEPSVTTRGLYPQLRHGHSPRHVPTQRKCVKFFIRKNPKLFYQDWTTYALSGHKTFGE